MRRLVQCASLIVLQALLLFPAPVQGQAPQLEEERGPVYSAAELRGKTTPAFGLRLGMPLDEAERIILQAGFRQKFNHWPKISETDGVSYALRDIFWRETPDYEWLQFHYIKLKGEQAVVSAIVYNQSAIVYGQEISNGQQYAEKMQQDVIAQFGKPSYWTRSMQDGKVYSHQMTYVTRPSLRDPFKIQDLKSCHVDWECDKVISHVDCRPIVAATRAPILQIDFSPSGTSYEWWDYGLAYNSLIRNPNFRRLDTKNATCSLMPIH